MSIDPIKEAGRKARGKRPYFLDSEQTEQLMTVVMAVAGELAVMRERLDTVERLLDEKGVLRREDIEAFRPDVAQAEERQLWHQEYLARILRTFQQQREAIAEAGRGGEEALEQVVQEFIRN